MSCFEGNVSVKAVILAGRRDVSEVWIDEKKDDRDTRFICAKARERNIPIKKMERSKIDEVASGKTHGGVICFAGKRTMQSIDECLNQPQPFIAILEGIEDPFNLGYAFRTLYAAGCSGVLLNERDWSNVDHIITKSSAGASEYINCCFSKDTSIEIQKCKEAGCIMVCAMRKDACDYYDVNYNQPLLLAIGGEMRGLSKGVLSCSDQNIVIPYANDFKNALNASSAIAALSFEIVRQRRT